MSWGKAFVRASIKKVNTMYVASIWYSFYGLYHYQVANYFEDENAAKTWILEERTNGHLVMTL